VKDPIGVKGGGRGWGKKGGGDNSPKRQRPFMRGIREWWKR